MTCTKEAPTCTLEKTCCYKVTRADADGVTFTATDLTLIGATAFKWPITEAEKESYTCASTEETGLAAWVAFNALDTTKNSGFTWTYACVAGAGKLVVAATAAIALAAY